MQSIVEVRFVRIYHYAIIFAILAMIFITIQDISYAQFTSTTKERRWLNQEFHKAVDAAVDGMWLDEEARVIHSSQAAIQVFFQSLYSSFDILDDPDAKLRLQLYIPTIAIIDVDGMYINYLTSISSEGSTQLIRTWSDKLSYSYKMEGREYAFYLSNLALEFAEDGRNQKLIETRDDLEVIRTATIRNTIEANLVSYMNQHNDIAKQYGIQYEFHLPAVDNSFHSRSIREPTMLILFQGYPLKGEEVFNYAAFGGTSLVKKHWYALTEEEGYYLYHRLECTALQEYSLNHEEKEQFICHSKEECALYGAFQCKECFPSGKNYDFLGYIHMKTR